MRLGRTTFVDNQVNQQVVRKWMWWRRLVCWARGHRPYSTFPGSTAIHFGVRCRRCHRKWSTVLQYCSEAPGRPVEKIEGIGIGGEGDGDR